MNNSQINNIEWKDGAVCYAFGKQWVCFDNYLLTNDKEKLASYEEILQYDDFQLNEPRQGYYIPKSELDNVHKYNDAVNIFGLFCFNPPSLQPLNYHLLKSCQYDFLLLSNDLFNTANLGANLKRKLTYNQLMAIGKLKRLMNERNNTVLSLDEETELKSRSMASELNSQSSDDEWPKVGDEVCWSNGCYKGFVKARHWNDLWVMESCGEFSTLYIDDVSKPKTPEDLLSEELAKKGVQDVYILACQIVNGEFDSIKYVPKGGK